MTEFRSPFLSRLVEDVSRKTAEVFETILRRAGVTEDKAYLCRVLRSETERGWREEIRIQGEHVGTIVTTLGEGRVLIEYSLLEEKADVIGRQDSEISGVAGDDRPGPEGLAGRAEA